MNTTATPIASHRFLFAPDFSYFGNVLAQQWIYGIVESLITSGVQVTFVGRDFKSEEFHQELSALGAVTIEPEVFGEESLDSTGVLARYRARQIIKVAKSSRADIVFAQGINLCRYLTGGKLLRDKLWALYTDKPVYPRALSSKDIKYLEQVAVGSKYVLAPNESIRSQIEAMCLQATAKTASMPLIKLRPRQDIRTPKSSTREAAQKIWVDLGAYRDTPLPSIKKFIKESRRRKSPPRLILCDSESNGREDSQSVIEKSGLLDFPGAQMVPYSVFEELKYNKDNTDNFILVPHQSNSHEQNQLFAFAQGVNAKAILDDDTNLEIIFSGDFERLETAERQKHSSFLFDDMAKLINALHPRYSNIPLSSKKINVLLAGADFKFAGDIVETLYQREDINLQVDLFKANATPQPETSRSYLAWADVVIAEFASKNAIWYSNNISKSQKLIVHLHGYELISEWIDELNINNVHSIIVASEFYRQKALTLKGWPESKVKVISNSVKVVDLLRPKSLDSRFHIGIVGIVPILKRPDRALDLLEELLKIDSRYFLHIRGHSPWNYAWEWKKAAHQDSYRLFYQRIKENKMLKEHIIFEPFSPDMGNWLKKIGWMLSTSTRETFHMAAVEAATSGAIPIAWEREGSREIIGEDFNVLNTSEAVARILATNTSEDTYRDYSERAHEFAVSRYESEFIGEKWVDEIQQAFSLTNYHASSKSSLSPDEQAIFDAVLTEFSVEGTEGALPVLDEHIRTTARLQGGALKDLELFIRGAVALDSKRYSLFKPALDEISMPKMSRANTTVVKQAGESDTNLSILGFELHALDVIPPHFIRDFAGAERQYLGHTYRLSVDENLRYDRWCEVIKSMLVDRLQSQDRQYMVASGPWWLAMPVALAADILGAVFIWHIQDNEDADMISSRQDSPYTADAVTQLCYQVFLRADAVLSSIPSLVCNYGASLKIVDLDSLLSNGLKKSLRNDETPRELNKHLSDMRIGVVAPNYISDEIEKFVGSVIKIPILNYFDSLSSNLDALLFFSSADESGDWQGRLSYNKDMGVTPPAKIMDRGRQLGVKSIFVHDRDGLIPLNLYATARKADSISASSADALSDFLQLNPSANTRAFITHGKCSTREFISQLLETVGKYSDQ